MPLVLEEAEERSERRKMPLRRSFLEVVFVEEVLNIPL
jgi:hypothetical protein